MKALLKPTLPLWIFFIAMGVRLFYLSGMEAYPKFELIKNRLDDQVVFDLWAKKILHRQNFDYATTGHEFAYWAAQNPGVYPQGPFYPHFIAANYRLFGIHYDRVRAIQMILGALGCVLIFYLAREFLSRWTAFACGLIAACYGPFVFYESTYLRASLFTTAAALNLFLLCRLRRKVRNTETIEYLTSAVYPTSTLSLAFITGASLALSVLLRANYLLFAVAAVGWFWWCCRRSNPGPSSRRLFFSLTLGLVLPLLPITIVNSVRSGGFAFLSSNGPYIFFISNVHDASGTSAGPSRYYQVVKNSRPPHEVNLLHEALADIRRHPQAFLRLQWRKLQALFSPEETPNNLSYAMAKKTNPRLALAFVDFFLLFPPALLGLIWSFKNARQFSLLYLFLFAFSAATVAFYVLARLRQPLVIVLILFAGLALERWLAGIRTRPWILSAIIFFGVLCATWQLKPGLPQHRMTDYAMASASFFSRGELLDSQGRHREALAWFARSLALNPEHQKALARIDASTPQLVPDALPPAAAALCEEARIAAQNDPPAALRQLHRARRLAPDHALPHQYLANVYFLQGHVQEAMEHLEKAVERDPGNRVLRDNLKALRHQTFADSSNSQ